MFSVSQIRFSVEYKKKGIIGDDQYVFRHDNTKERKNSLAQDIPKVLVPMYLLSHDIRNYDKIVKLFVCLKFFIKKVYGYT